MTDVTISRETLELAIGALENALPTYWTEGARIEASTALRTALTAQPAEPVGFDRTTALVLLSAAAKSGDPGAISLAAQLAGAAPCKDCGFVNFKCRCAAQPAEPVAIAEGDAFRYHKAMHCLLNMQMQHGLCEPRSRKACTHCNAKDRLDAMIAEYRGPMVVLNATAAATTPAQPAEPVVAWMHIQGNHTEPSLRRLDDDEIARGWTEVPLYAAVPAAVPLTDAEIDAILYNSGDAYGLREFARAVLAAAGDKPPTPAAVPQLRLERKPCGDCWLHMSAPSGNRASINLGQRGAMNDISIVGRVMVEIAAAGDKP